jgi:TPR repeat protein
MTNHRHRTMILACGPALVMLAVIAGDRCGPALADPNQALVNAVTEAFTPAQISALIASAAGNGGSHTDQETQSLDHLQRLLDVSGDVAVALLRILDRPDIQPAESAQVLAQSAIQYHAVTDRLTEISSEDPDGQRLVTQAQAAMTAGHFNDTEVLLRKLQDREATFSNRTPDGVTEPASSVAQHLISAAQAGTVLGEIALMKLRYGEATDYFQAAQQRLALMAYAQPDPAETPPGKSGPVAAADATPGQPDATPGQPADTPLTAETRPPLPPPEVVSSVPAGPPQPVPQTDADHPGASPEQSPAAIMSGATAANQTAAQMAAVTTAAPRGLREPPPEPPSAGATQSAEMLNLLLRRGDTLLALGDVSSARLLFERAAAGGDGRGATGAGKTYDPVFLLRIGARGIQGDPVAAANWYRRAIELGDRSAVERLTQMSQRSSR